MKWWIISALLLPALGSTAQVRYFPLPKKEAGGYFISIPEGPVKGILLVIPRPGQDVEALLEDSAWSASAHDKGLALAGIPHPGPLLLTPALQRQFSAIFRDAGKRLNTEPSRIALAGLGEGGILALQFTQECWSAPMRYPYRPGALVCMETPVDLAAWWAHARADLERNSSPRAVAKAIWITQSLEKELGGAPDTLQTIYQNRSPFSTGLQDQGKERFLLQTGLQLYYEGDLQSQLQQGRQWPELTAAPAFSMIGRLLREGHTRASFHWILPAKSDSPWGSVAPESCLQWVSDCLSIQD